MSACRWVGPCAIALRVVADADAADVADVAVPVLLHATASERSEPASELLLRSQEHHSGHRGGGCCCSHFLRPSKGRAALSGKVPFRE